MKRFIETRRTWGQPRRLSKSDPSPEGTIMKTQFFATVLVAAVGFMAAPVFAGDNISGEVGYVPQVSTTVSGLTREAVRAEVLQAERNGTMPELGEGADIGAVATAKSTLSRDAVRAEAVYAVRHGQLPGGEV
nr:DUF4148 domain-containing protein [Variovorax boronicumulans]